MSDLKRYTCVIGDYPDDEGYGTETYQDPDGELYMADDVDDLLSKKGWISVDGYKQIPNGKWLVKFEDNDVEVMKVNRNNQGSVIASAGNQFAFDLPRVISYMRIPK